MTLTGPGDAPRPAELAEPERPALSVVIVSYRCLDLLTSCLESLGEGADGMPIEVIVIDNASGDGTVEAVGEAFPWVRLVAAPENIGFAAASNRGIEMASGRHLLLLNPDTLTPAGALRKAVEALDARPDVGMLGCKLVLPGGGLDHAAKRGFPTPGSALAYFSGLAKLRPRSPRLARYTAGHLSPDEASPVDAVNGAFMLVRREAVEAVGPLDEDFWLYMEDLDWCYRFWEAGWPVLYWPGAEVVHVKGGSATKNRSWRANHAFHRGMWLFYRKHYLANRSPVVSGLVWLAVWGKLGMSAARSLVARRAGT